MTSGLAAHGMITIDDTERVVDIEIVRPARIDYLKQQLTGWERWGYVSWSFLNEQHKG